MDFYKSKFILFNLGYILITYKKFTIIYWIKIELNLLHQKWE